VKELRASIGLVQFGGISGARAGGATGVGSVLRESMSISKSSTSSSLDCALAYSSPLVDEVEPAGVQALLLSLPAVLTGLVVDYGR